MADAETQFAAEKEALEQIVRGAPVAEVLARLCRSAESLSPGGLCAVQLVDGSGARLSGAASPGVPDGWRDACEGMAVGPGSAAPGEAAWHGAPVFTDDITGDPRWAPWRDAALAHGLRSCWALPILSDQRVIGAFSLYHREARARGPSELRTIEDLAAIADIAISRKRMEAQLLTANRLASVGTLAAGLAHEINNPLAFILGNISFLRARLADVAGLPGGDAMVREMDEALADCAEGARRIESIVRDLRTFSRSSDEQPGPVDLRRVLEFAVRMVFNEVRHRARLQRDFDHAPIALGDEGRLVQVVVNLLSNAAQAMPDRSSEENEVTLSARAEAGEAIIEVRDNGVGIPADRLPRIFDPFFTTRPAGQGTGLGLAISHGLVTAMRGRLTVESTPGLGSRFQVVLPLAPPAAVAARTGGASDAPAAQGAAAGTSSAAGAPPFPDGARRDSTNGATPGSIHGAAHGAAHGAPSRRLRLLVIDDETLVGASIRRLVGQRYDVLHVEDARTALELCGRESFDAVLCDLMMPALTGMELHAELERIRPELAQRTGFITGGAFTERAREFAGLHAARCLEKPFTTESVQALVERLVA